MSMGQSKKTESFDTYGVKHINRAPQKPLSAPVKNALLKTIKDRKDIVLRLERQPGTDVITVETTDGTALFRYENGYDYGYYVISMLNRPANSKAVLEPVTDIAEMDWFENDHNTNQQQQDIFDIWKALNDRLQEQENLKKLSAEDISALKVLGFSGNTK